MSEIKLLPEILANQISAGEVIERPASVIKELIDNSIDAQAKNIEVYIQKGGISLIKVIDDGIGMNRDDAIMCLEKNATSKIKTKDDFDNIHTLGFRGEAIPSITSVSKFKLTTRQKNSLCGTEIQINGGKLINVKDSGEAPGTQIEVRSLFYNIPARRKFLRTQNTEYAHIEQSLKTQAIANQGIRFSLIHGDRLVFKLSKSNDLKSRISELTGAEFSNSLLEIKPFNENGIKINGFVGPPGMGRNNKKHQLSFLNKRLIESPIITRALREAYHTVLMKGQFPVTFLFIEMDPKQIDFNVHPTKREVRFYNGYIIQKAIIDAVKNTLDTKVNISSSNFLSENYNTVNHNNLKFIKKKDNNNLNKEEYNQDENLDDFQTSLSLIKDDSLNKEQYQYNSENDLSNNDNLNSKSITIKSEEGNKQISLSNCKYLGVLGKLYVLFENSDGLLLMDQHAAHERVLFEEMQRRVEIDETFSQQLLTPIIITLLPKDYDLIEQSLDIIKKIGINIEPFGGKTIKIDGIPSFIKINNPEDFLQKIIDEIKISKESLLKTRLDEDSIATTVCRHAVKANDVLSEVELKKLFEDLFSCKIPYCCPHGRPTLIQKSYKTLEKSFGRIV